MILFFLFYSFSLFGEIAWEPTEYIWNLGIMLQCDKKYHQIPDRFRQENYQNIKEGDLVYIKSGKFDRFVNEILPTIRCRFILVTGDDDHSMPLHYHPNPLFLLNDKRLIHWFTQNYDYMGLHPKISPIPIGLDFHSITVGSKGAITPKMQEDGLKEILSTLKPTTERSLKILGDFHFNNSSAMSFSNFKERFGYNRSDIHEMFQDSDIVEFLPSPVPRDLLWKLQGERAFTISPYGVGLDCHRTWEHLVLGCIVIMKSTPLDPLFEGLPVVLIDDYSEITKENLEKWLSEYGDVFHNPSYREKLTLAYWMNKILAARHPEPSRSFDDHGNNSTQTKKNTDYKNKSRTK